MLITYNCSVERVFSLIEIHEQVRSRLQQMCTKRDGFYEDVEQIIVLSARASPRGMLICECKCVIKTFLPREGDVCVARFEKYIKEKGVICSYKQLQILVPSRYIESFEVKEFLRVKIEKLRYQVGTYRAVATLLD